VMSYFGFWLPGFVSVSFQSTSIFFTSGFLPHFLVGFCSLLCLKGLICAKLFAKLY
jgi:hypothetical protein